MNSETSASLNNRNLTNSTEAIFQTLNSQEGSRNDFVELQPNSSDLIMNESSGDSTNYQNQNEYEVLFNLNPEDQTLGDASGGPDTEEPELPSTTIMLQTKWGSKIYVVGTAHFSSESQEDVARVIRAVQPNSVVIELCHSRSKMLTWDEEKLVNAQNMNHKTIKEAIKTYGVFQGAVNLLLLSMSMQITKEMGMAPGGEFRRAFKESLAIPGCVVFLGDRPIEITLRRAFATMTWWQSIKFAYCVIFSKIEINKEEIEKFKNKDYLGNMLEIFGGEFPGLKEVFVNERDLFLTYSLVKAAMITPQDNRPRKVVGVVGMGHLLGIQQNWESGRLELSEVQRLLDVPPESKTSKVLKFALKAFYYGLTIYGLHKLASKTRFYPFQFRHFDSIRRKASFILMSLCTYSSGNKMALGKSS